MDRRDAEMSEAIERAAKAIEDDLCGIYSDAHLIQIARAALATTRDPTPAMIAAGAKRIPGSSQRECAEAVWRVMWDAMMGKVHSTPRVPVGKPGTHR
jgi:hypothetical protein